MTPTLKELLGRATPGPWKPEYGYVKDVHGNNVASITMRGYDDPAAIANAEIVARCSPANMALVLEALEEARDDYTRGVMKLDTVRKISASLVALNGTALNKP